MTPSRSGFTLIELSVVITIIALLVGGVIAGRTLLKTADADIVIAERTQYANAVIGFKEKYKSLPGDMPDAYDFWGATCGTNTNALSTGCNGNGNGIIIPGENGENVRAWEHLKLAGLVPGNFDGTGTNDGGGGVILTATNTMQSKYPKGFWDLTSDAGNTPAPTGSVFLRFGGLFASGQNSVYYHPSLTHAEAWKIDMKIDDGKANSGKVQGDSGADCYDNGTDYYNIATLGQEFTGDCVLTFMFLQQY